MKRCAQCHGELGLGVRSRNLWNGRWWVHVRYCSIHCELVMRLNESTNGLRLLVIPGVQVVKGELTARVRASP